MEINLPHSPSKDKFGGTASIIFNLSKLGISVEDSKHFDIDTYIELIEIEMELNNKESGSRYCTQADIDAFLF